MGLGTFGVWREFGGFTKESVAELERLGYGTVWLGSSPPASLDPVEPLLEATETITVATGIVNIWSAPAAEVAESFHRIEQRFPGRFLLGVGAGHPEATAEYRSPYEALVEYLDVLDKYDVPIERRVLAALGPKVLKLARDRAAGAHPYLVPPAHTKLAREILGPDKILAPEHKVALTPDTAVGREVGRARVDSPYLYLSNYVKSFERLGFTEDDVAHPGSDRLIDAVVAHGDAATIAAKLAAHLAAGADHVAIQALPAADDPLPVLRALAAHLAG